MKFILALSILEVQCQWTYSTVNRLGQAMVAITEFAIWVKEPSREVAVVIVSSAGLPKYIIDRLYVAIADWDEVSYMIVRDTQPFLDNWLGAENRLDASAAESKCQASEMLRSISKSCYLLDVEDGAQARLAWLGSVCGHKLRFLKLDQVISPDSAKSSMDAQVERILSAARGLVTNLLEVRFLGL